MLPQPASSQAAGQGSALSLCPRVGKALGVALGVVLGQGVFTALGVARESLLVGATAPAGPALGVLAVG